MNLKEKIWMWIAWHLPKELVKWCVSRVFANASTGSKYSSVSGSEITVVQALEEWK